MSKYTKVIAALGVAAGLGVASLPFGAFAAEYVGKGQVEVQLTVPDVITMTIDGNNVIDGATVNGTAINLGEIEAGKSANSGSDKTVISVKTNKPNGYTLQAKGTVLTNENKTTETIGVLSADGGTALKAEGNKAADEGWGIHVAMTAPASHAHSAISGAANFGQDDKYYMTTTDSPIDSFNIGDIEGEATFEYNITYGANVQEGKAAGIYKGTATYTVTGVANNAS